MLRLNAQSPNQTRSKSIKTILIVIAFGITPSPVKGQQNIKTNTAKLTPIYQLLLNKENTKPPTNPPTLIDSCTTHFVKDINLGQADAVLTQNPLFTQVGQQLFFRAETAQHGLELWTTDGTTTGTRLVKDINPGSSDSVSIGAGLFTSINNTLLFVAKSPLYGNELWRSDGTTSGTQLVKDMTPGKLGPSHQARLQFNNKLYFLSQGRFDLEDEGLWVSDGTTTGTRLIKDTHPFNSNIGGSKKMAMLNNRILFRADGEDGREEPWVSDGSPSGTSLLKKVTPNNILSEADGFKTIGNKTFFFANDQIHGMELWVSDGSTAGTKLVKDIKPGSGDGVGANNFSFTSKHFLNLNNMAVFVADNGIHGRELWISDGTTGGTRMIRDIAIGSQESLNNWTLENATVLNNKLYFAADDHASSNSNREIWVSDGTIIGTHVFADLNTNSSSSPEQFFSAHGLIFMRANGNSNFGNELWAFDESGRQREFNINPNGWSSPEHFFNFNGQIMFFAETNQYGNELWRVDCEFN